jgi:hypothetical protein
VRHTPGARQNTSKNNAHASDHTKRQQEQHTRVPRLNMTGTGLFVCRIMAHTQSTHRGSQHGQSNSTNSTSLYTGSSCRPQAPQQYAAQLLVEKRFAAARLAYQH